MAKEITKPVNLKVIDRDGFVLGKIPARVGLKTYHGEVIRLTPKGVWCRDDEGHEQLYRECDGRLPCIYKSYAPKDEVIWGKL